MAKKVEVRFRWTEAEGAKSEVYIRDLLVSSLGTAGGGNVETETKG